jgi:hypothetical protein
MSTSLDLTAQQAAGYPQPPAGPSDRRGTDSGIAGKEQHMTVKITYLLTEQAQRDAMAATGVPVPRTQIIEAEAVLADLDLYAVAADGTPSMDLTVPSHRHLSVLVPGRFSSPHQWGSLQTCESLIATLRAAYAARDARDAAAAAAEAAKIQAEADHDYDLAAALDYHHWTSESDRVRRTPATDLVHPRSLPVPVHMPLSRVAQAAYCARWTEQRKAAAALVTAAEEAKEQTKLAAISTWIAEHGTPLQQARHTDGLMSRAEAIKLMATWVMDQYQVPPEDDRQVCSKRECPCSETEITSLSEAAYEVWADVRHKLPGNHTTTFWRVTKCPPRDEYGDRDEAAAGTHTAA